MNNRPQTPEEERWMASVLDPVKAKGRIKYGYILLTVWVAFLIGWLVSVIRSDEPFRWADGFLILVPLLGAAGAIVGIVNNRRIARGRKPL
ncbi:hypothetical protein [Alistipes sp.]|uniref:hypothetical protein n=1 Tax=Alistipes sp. TaxID=1872444 RepID=UPI003AF17D1F